MRKIELRTWPRRKHFEFFSTFDHPHFNMCANMELTRFHQYVRDSGVSFTVAWVYVITRAANDVPEFRYRIREGGVVEHDAVSPSLTILAKDDLFSFCTIPYGGSYADFVTQGAARIAQVREDPTLENESDRDDLLFMTALPWVSFTSFTHPMQLHPSDSIPRFAWGKFFREGQDLKIPLSVQGHHAVMDGLHMARWYERVETYLAHPGAWP